MLRPTVSSRRPDFYTYDRWEPPNDERDRRRRVNRESRASVQNIGGGIKSPYGYVGGGPGNDYWDDSDDDQPLIARPAQSRLMASGRIKRPHQNYAPAGGFDIHHRLAHLNLADTSIRFGPTDESVFAFQEPTPEEIQDRRHRMAMFQSRNMGAMPPNPQNFVTMQGGQRVPIGYELNPALLNWQQTYAARGPQL